MEEMKDKINSKFFEIGALIFLKNKGFINEQEFIKIKRVFYRGTVRLC